MVEKVGISIDDPMKRFDVELIIEKISGDVGDNIDAIIIYGNDGIKSETRSQYLNILNLLRDRNN